MGDVDYVDGLTPALGLYPSGTLYPSSGYIIARLRGIASGFAAGLFDLLLGAGRPYDRVPYAGRVERVEYPGRVEKVRF